MRRPSTNTAVHILMSIPASTAIPAATHDRARVCRSGALALLLLHVFVGDFHVSHGVLGRVLPVLRLAGPAADEDKDGADHDASDDADHDHGDQDDDGAQVHTVRLRRRRRGGRWRRRRDVDGGAAAAEANDGAPGDRRAAKRRLQSRHCPGPRRSPKNADQCPAKAAPRADFAMGPAGGAWPPWEGPDR